MEVGRVGVRTRTDGMSVGELPALHSASRISVTARYGSLTPSGVIPLPTRAGSCHTPGDSSSPRAFNIHQRDPLATASAQKELHDQSDGRFLLGLGVSHATMIERLFQREYPSPCQA